MLIAYLILPTDGTKEEGKKLHLDKSPHWLATSRCFLSPDSPSWKATESGDKTSEFFLELTQPLVIPLFVCISSFKALTILGA